MKHFKFYSKQDILSATNIRRFETKLGESVQFVKSAANWIDDLQKSTAKYVLLGIPEDIGIKANNGTGNEYLAWFPFLPAFLNIQSNDFLSGENILLLGHFDFTEVKEVIELNAASIDEKTEAYRHAVNWVDEEVENLVKVITQIDKIPILIGGGHNNAYPAIKGAAKGLYKAGYLPLAQINCINLDSHAHYQPMEGRHSGNSFRYADEDGYLNKYCIVGLHESYLQQNVWTDMIDNPFVDFISYEDIFIHDKKNFTQAVAYATGFTEDSYTGIDIDLACVQDASCSASNPSGISALQARQFINFVATDAKVAYVHICEGGVELSDGKSYANRGKLISYLVSDFIKAHASR